MLGHTDCVLSCAPGLVETAEGMEGKKVMIKAAMEEGNREVEVVTVVEAHLGILQAMSSA